MSHTNITSKSELDTINNNTIRGYDKWFRMFCGIASNLDRYENGIIYLTIKSTEKKYLLNYNVALKFVKMWIGWNKELESAIGFVVLFHKSTSTGFMVDAKDKRGMKELAMKFENRKEILVNIVSSLL